MRIFSKSQPFSSFSLLFASKRQISRSHCLHGHVQDHPIRQLVPGQSADSQLRIFRDAELQQGRAGAHARHGIFQKAHTLNGTKGGENGVQIEPQLRVMNMKHHQNQFVFKQIACLDIVLIEEALQMSRISLLAIKLSNTNLHLALR